MNYPEAELRGMDDSMRIKNYKILKRRLLYKESPSGTIGHVSILKVMFYGSSSYCLPILQALKSNFHLICIITKTHSRVQRYATENHIKFFTPRNKIGLLALKEKLKSLQSDIAVVADFGMITPKDIFDIPKYKTLNIHFSKLPKLRGASPVQFTILNGEKSAWISIIIMDEGLDTGDILWQKLALQGETLRGYTTQDLYQKLFTIAGENITQVIKNYITGQLKPIKQDHTKATYTKILTRGDGFIPFSNLQKTLAGGPLARNIEQKHLAYTPFPGLWTKIKIGNALKRLKLLKLHTKDDELILDLVQLEGKNPVTWKQFLEGHAEISTDLKYTPD